MAKPISPELRAFLGETRICTTTDELLYRAYGQRDWVRDAYLSARPTDYGASYAWWCETRPRQWGNPEVRTK